MAALALRPLAATVSPRSSVRANVRRVRASATRRDAPVPASALAPGAQFRAALGVSVTSTSRGSRVAAAAVPAWHPDANPSDLDPDEPTPGFASIPEALADVAAGKFVVVLDDEDRENEGDLIGAADKMTQESMHFMIRHSSGLVCVSVPDATADRLNLPLMVSSKENEDAMKTAFTVSVDLATSTTGISAAERAATIAKLGDPNAEESDFVRPGHVFPLRYREGGVLKRTGHTEAALDLARMAGCGDAGVLCEIVKDEDGSMARLPDLKKFSEEHGLKMVLISDMVRYRRKREQLVELFDRLTNGAVPMAAVAVSTAIYDAFMATGGPDYLLELPHGYTYSGHPVASAAGLAVLGIAKKEGLFERAAELAPYFEEAVHSLKGIPNVIDIRNFGLAAGVELEPRGGIPGERGFDVFKTCFEQGILSRVTGDILALAPAMIAEKTHIDQLVETLGNSIRDTN